MGNVTDLRDKKRLSDQTFSCIKVLDEVAKRSNIVRDTEMLDGNVCSSSNIFIQHRVG